MSDPEQPKRFVARLLRENNVELNELIKGVLHRIAGDFWAAGLVTKHVADGMHVTGVDHFELAGKLMNACQPSLEQYPEEKFPKFIAVLKKYETMKQLAEKMESEFKEARKSYNPPGRSNTLTEQIRMKESKMKQPTRGEEREYRQFNSILALKDHKQTGSC